MKYRITLAAALAAAALAVPGTAMASAPSGTVAATVTIPSTATFTLSTSSFSFGTATDGQTVGNTSPGAGEPTLVTATVSTNDASGYSIVAQATDFVPGTWQASSLTTYVVGPAGGTTTPFQMAESAPVTIGTKSSGTMASSDTWGTSWTVAVPQDIPAGTYSTTITYTLITN